MAKATQTVEEIVEAGIGGTLSYALGIHEAQIAADNFVDQFLDPNHFPREVDWRAVDHAGIPREFFELAQRFADYEVRLPTQERST